MNNYKNKTAKTIYLFLAICLYTNSVAQEKVYYVGHSLVNLNMPYMTRQIATIAGVSNTYRHHINIGTALKRNWEDTGFNMNDIWDPSIGANVEYGSNHLQELQNPYQHIVLTEAVNLLENNRDTTVKYATNFYNYAQINNPTIKQYLFATWEHSNNNWTNWRSDLANLQTQWEDIANQTAITTGKTTYIVPGNLALMALYDTLQQHPIADKITISQFFTDDIHLTSEGNYFIACLMSAVVYHIDPRDQESIKAGPYTNDTVVISPVLRLKLQTIAWQTACAYNRTGYNCATAAIQENKPSIQPLILQGAQVYTDSNVPNNTILNVYTIDGKCWDSQKINNNNCEIKKLPSGIYLYTLLHPTTHTILKTGKWIVTE